MSAENVLRKKAFKHPYSFEIARQIRTQLIFQEDTEIQKEFLESLMELFPSRFAEILNYMSKDYRIFLRDDQLWTDFESDDHATEVFCCGRAWGKALKNSELVQVPNGWSRIDNLAVGDEILTKEGSVQAVTGVYPQGTVPLYSINTFDGRRSECCHDHLWTGYLGNNLNMKGEEITITAKELSQHLKAGKIFYIPTVNGDEDSQKPSELTIEPYALGALLGDGNMTERHVGFSSNDIPVVEKIKAAGYEVTKWKSKYEYGVKGVIGKLRELGLQGKSSHTKFIPPEYLSANFEQRTALLQGLMDTDGSIEIGGRMEFTTVGTQLKDDFLQLCWSLGLTAKAAERITHCNGKPFKSYRIRITVPVAFKPFTLERHLDRMVRKERHNFIKITSFEDIKSEEATCISVSGEDKLFVTNSFMVTHNTWAGSPATIEYAIENPGCHIGLLAPTFNMGKSNMIENASGILELSPKGFKPVYNKSEGSLTWPNGSTARLFSAENGGRVRGQNFNFLWADEWCFFKYPKESANNLWTMAKMALRKGDRPKSIITTSPMPVKHLRELHKESLKENSRVIFHTGTTFENYSLPQDYIDDVLSICGTRLYNQEILGQILEDNDDAIFTMADIKRKILDTNDDDLDHYNEKFEALIKSMDELVIAVDPHVVEDPDSDETGITICGRKGKYGYVFKDASRRGRISGIYEYIVDLYHFYLVDSVIIETNNGGDVIPTLIANIDPMVRTKTVFASKGKRARAEPIGALYERGLIHHVGIFPTLEAQMCGYNPQVDKKSPD